MAESRRLTSIEITKAPGNGKFLLRIGLDHIRFITAWTEQLYVRYDFVYPQGVVGWYLHSRNPCAAVTFDEVGEAAQIVFHEQGDDIGGDYD